MTVKIVFRRRRMTMKIVFAHFTGEGLPSIRTVILHASPGEKWPKHSRDYQNHPKSFSGPSLTIKLVFADFTVLGLPSIRTAIPQASSGQAKTCT